MDKRLKEINERLIDFSFGRFDRRISISDKKDLLDGISNAINMLGEELNGTVITKNYFNTIFNSVSDMIFILGQNNVIVDLNETALQKLQFSREELLGKKFFSFLQDHTIKGNNFKKSFQANPGIKTKSRKHIPVRVTLSPFHDTTGKKLKIVSATDISLEILQQNVNLRAIIDTQESERQRIAKDLHDTIIQELSAVTLEIGGTINSINNKSVRADIQKSNQALFSVIREVRNICFNIMPSLLKEFGLIKAVHEFSATFKSHTTFQIIEDLKLPPLSEQLKIDLYRILQELISNSVRHGKASLIIIKFSEEKNNLKISFKDNGQGFNTRKFKRGMGLQNIQSRVKSNHGYFTMESSEGKGSSFLVSVPIAQIVWQA